MLSRGLQIMLKNGLIISLNTALIVFERWGSCSLNSFAIPSQYGSCNKSNVLFEWIFIILAGLLYPISEGWLTLFTLEPSWNFSFPFSFCLFTNLIDCIDTFNCVLAFIW